MGIPDVVPPNNGGGFTIGETAAIVGVSTHVIRSWERRLSLALNHRTPSNQRRYWLEDVQRFVAIRRLHVASGLPLTESAARALNAPARGATAESPHLGPARIKDYWARLVDALPELLLVVDETGRVMSANALARARLNLRLGASFARLAPGGWRQTYQSLRRGAGNRHQPATLAVRSRSGIVFMDARFVPLTRTPNGPVVVIGSHVRERSAVANGGRRLAAIDA